MVTTPSRKSTIWYACLPALATFVMIFFIMLTKGVFPLGNREFTLVDYNEQVIPTYTGLWDALHGRVNFLVNWNLGAGGSMVTAFFINGFLSPLAWLVALFPRDAVMSVLPWLYTLRFMLMATTAAWCFRRWFPRLNPYLHVLFSLLWTFSGWTWVHFSNPNWLDVMILLPVLLVTARNLVENHRLAGFVATLTAILITSYYIAFMVLIGTVVVAFYYVLCLAPNRKQVVTNLVVGIGLSVLISAVVVLPSMLIGLQSHRFAGDAADGWPWFWIIPAKLIILLLTPLPLCLFIKLMFSYRRDRRPVLFFLLTFVTMMIGVIVEPINAMWHTGSYVCYPFRYSFLIIGLMIMGALYYLDRERQNRPPAPAPERTTYYIVMVLFAVICVTLAVIYAVVAQDVHPYQLIGYDVICLAGAAVVFMLLVVGIVGEFKFKSPAATERFRWLTVGSLALIVLVIHGFGFIGVNAVNGGTFTTQSMQIPTADLVAPYKLKDRECRYGLNFAQITGVPSMQTWIHISPDAQFQGYQQMGYLHQKSSPLFSAGGTMMTDVLLGNRYVLSTETLDPDYYLLRETFACAAPVPMHLYEMNFNFQPVFTTDVDLAAIWRDVPTDLVAAQNYLYRNLFHDTAEIMTAAPVTVTQTADAFQLTGTVVPGQNVHLVLPLTGNTFHIDTPAGDREIYYGLNDFGTAATSTFTLTIPKADQTSLTVATLEKIQVACFDAARFQQVYADTVQTPATLTFRDHQIQINLNNTDAPTRQFALVPFIALNQMTATDQGQTCPIETTLGAFMVVPLSAGEHAITITYRPQYFNYGIIITLVGVGLTLLVVILNWRCHLLSRRWVVGLGWIAGIVVLVAVAGIIYVVPFGRWLFGL